MSRRHQDSKHTAGWARLVRPASGKIWHNGRGAALLLGGLWLSAFGPREPRLSLEEGAADAALPSSVAAQPAIAPIELEEDCGGRSNVFCLSVHLSAGAVLKPFMGAGPLDGGGFECRGWSNRFENLSVSGFTQLATIYDGRSIADAAVVLSGSFHDGAGRPAFPQKVKERGWISTFGYECSAAGGANDMLMLQIRNSERRAFIETFDLARFQDPSSAPEIIVGLSPRVSKRGNSSTGRNFVGLKNPHNGGYGTVVFVIAASNPGLTSQAAIDLLKQKGCVEDRIMQLDGSTVAQLSVREQGAWNHVVTYGRRMPQVIAVFSS